MTYSVKQ